MKVLTINVGFITNSSSAIHWYNKAVLDAPEVQAFLKTYEIENGYIGRDVWHRGECDTLAITKEQKTTLKERLGDSEFCTPPDVDTEDDNIVVIYGDEYGGITQSLSHLLDSVARKKGFNLAQSEYN